MAIKQKQRQSYNDVDTLWSYLPISVQEVWLIVSSYFCYWWEWIMFASKFKCSNLLQQTALLRAGGFSHIKVFFSIPSIPILHGNSKALWTFWKGKRGNMNVTLGLKCFT